jgi:hypothetical protein
MSRPNKNDGGGQTSVAEAEIEPLDAANSSNKNKTKTTVSQKVKFFLIKKILNMDLDHKCSGFLKR